MLLPYIYYNNKIVLNLNKIKQSLVTKASNIDKTLKKCIATLTTHMLHTYKKCYLNFSKAHM